MRLYLTPASGLYSKVVTTGPGLICTTDPVTLNSSNLLLIRLAMSFSSCVSYGGRACGSVSRAVGGSRNADFIFLGGAVRVVGAVSSSGTTLLGGGGGGSTPGVTG